MLIATAPTIAVPIVQAARIAPQLSETHASAASLDAAAIDRAAPWHGELSDDDLEQVVGGLARSFVPSFLMGSGDDAKLL